MKAYEYTTVNIGAYEDDLRYLIEDLDRYGKNGWKAVGLIRNGVLLMCRVKEEPQYPEEEI